VEREKGDTSIPPFTLPQSNRYDLPQDRVRERRKWNAGTNLERKTKGIKGDPMAPAILAIFHPQQKL